ncbi:MAG: riboflavin synthase [Candidatus Omnitrophica bacterium]|nr:riboflavin synthase [Candidatus Omnitrophota bacterium]
MFTGIIEEIGVVRKIVRGPLLHISVGAPLVQAGTKAGDSISVNGVCLTAVQCGGALVSFDVVKETQDKTNLGGLRAGDGVNLERAATAATRLGGHIVSGHIDGSGVIAEKKNRPEGCWLKIKTDIRFVRQLIPQGSVAIDGVSLTIADLGDDFFQVVLIPHTLHNTTLAFKELAAPVNLEADMIGKYVYQYLSRLKIPKAGFFPEADLKKMGFVDE